MSWFKRKPRPPKPDNWEEIIQAYGAVLADENPTYGIGRSRSEAELPFDKASIKSALIGALSQGELTPAQMDALGVGFVQLADFQPNGGKPSVLWTLARNGLPEGAADRDQLQREILAQADDEKKMAETIRIEGQALLNEWQQVKAAWVQLHTLNQGKAQYNV